MTRVMQWNLRQLPIRNSGDLCYDTPLLLNAGRLSVHGGPESMEVVHAWRAESRSVSGGRE